MHVSQKATHLLLSICACLCVSIPGQGGCKLAGGLTLVNPLLGVLRMMMWAVDPPWWFHFLRASSGSQIERLWGYYNVRGWLTLNMMTIPCWHFHFLKRLILSGSWGERCLLIFCSNKFSFAFKGQYMLQICSLALLCLSPCTYNAYPRKILINMAFQGICMHEIRLCLSHTNVPFCTIFRPFHFVLQMPSEVRPCSQPVGVADVFNGTWFVSWCWDKHGEEIKTPGFLPQSLAFILLCLRMPMLGQHSRL